MRSKPSTRRSVWWQGVLGQPCTSIVPVLLQSTWYWVKEERWGTSKKSSTWCVCMGIANATPHIHKINKREYYNQIVPWWILVLFALVTIIICTSDYYCSVHCKCCNISSPVCKLKIFMVHKRVQGIYIQWFWGYFVVKYLTRKKRFS